MIQGASQADIGVLVISGRRGEFEAGFNRGGQTREHAMLAKTLGITRLIVLVNKMDEESVLWRKERYDEIITKLGPFLKSCGFKPNSIDWLPVSGMTGANLNEPVRSPVCDWYEGPSFLQALDNLKPLKRAPNAPVRVPVVDKYKDRGCVAVMGKVEAGTVYQGGTLVVQPSGLEVEVSAIEIDETEANMAACGENVVLYLKGCNENDIHSGFVLCAWHNQTPLATKFSAQMALLELLPHKPLLTKGYQAVLHIHAVSAECEIVRLHAEMDKRTGQPISRGPRFVKSGAIVQLVIQVNDPIAIESFAAFPQLGRFTLRDEGKTIAIGKVLKLLDSQGVEHG
eukprot:GABV01000272.1.p2 GENE.GABV01000272.1~~GABV01000272.1.p2  ORF type:complete len:341 (-),score=126.94 GABV01000272.1:11-1033(-)